MILDSKLCRQRRKIGQFGIPILEVNITSQATLSPYTPEDVDEQFLWEFWAPKESRSEDEIIELGKCWEGENMFSSDYWSKKNSFLLGHRELSKELHKSPSEEEEINLDIAMAGPKADKR
ncbi:predicted protein [Nematostella vectensis]|uniref:Uncharacterized protein n=1 Tax=Nematostella vectensis TaxID=45351 RepID=A7RI10_NEMVE|nr:predicted protein [Nematostella vectensis]|eukprot:XP_001641013.1 predicted protein [Nematostella vectensis]